MTGRWAGNSAYDELNFTWDVTAPTFTSLNGANEASNGYVNDAEKGSTAALFTLVAANYTAATYSTAQASGVTCNVSITYSSSSMPAINSLTTDGSYAYCVRLTDAAGNITYGKSQTIVRDTGIPTVNAGADVLTNGMPSINATTSGATTYA